jgi:tRNA G10  N-methylase Trm11
MSVGVFVIVSHYIERNQYYYLYYYCHYYCYKVIHNSLTRY